VTHRTVSRAHADGPNAGAPPTLDDMTPNADRALAYGRVVKTLDDLGPTKLLPDEQDIVRQAADALLFEDDAYEELARVEDLVERLVEADRWTPERARELVDDVAACGPLAGARE
jgi:hypothetical protein